MANLGNLIVRGVTRILGDAYANKFIGNLQGNADTATSAIKASTADSATSATSANKASIATAVQDYGTSSYKEIKIGYSGSGLSSSTIETAVGFTDSGTKIKDISKDEFRNWLATASGTWPITVSNSSNSANAEYANYLNVTNSNEFRFGNISSDQTVLWFNYANPDGTQNNVSTYLFGDGKHGTNSTIRAAQFTGNAATATKLATSRTIWGQSFDGTGNVSGALTGVTDITASGHTKVNSLKTQYICIECDNSGNIAGRSSEINNYDGPLYLQYNTSNNCAICGGGGNVAIGPTSPSYKLHVVGDIYTTTGFKKEGSSDSYVLLGGGGHKEESGLSVNYANSAGNADTVDNMHASTLLHLDGYYYIPGNGTNSSTKLWSKIGSITFTGAWQDCGGSLTFYEWEALRMMGELKFNIRTSSSKSAASSTIVWMNLTNKDFENSFIICRTGDGKYDIYFEYPTSSYNNVRFYIISQYDNGYLTWQNGSALTSTEPTYVNERFVSRLSSWVGNADYATSAGTASTANSVAWDNITGKPSSFNPSSHSHPYLPTTEVSQEQASNDDWIRKYALSTLRGHVYNTHSLEWQYLFGISSGKTYGSILRTSYGNGTPRIQVMGLTNGTWSSWREVAYDDNTVKKDGTGASGTWNININGNAATATNANAVNGVSLTWDGEITSSQWIAAWESETSIKPMSAYNTFISMCSYLDEGSSDVTDGTMFITSYATDNGFADPNGKNKPYKRKASLLWNYINNKCSSIYATQSWVNSNFYTCYESNNRYIQSETDPIWTADKVNYYTKTECNNKFQLKGAYLTEQNLQGYATTTWVNSNYYTCSESDSRYIQSENDPVWTAAKGNYYTKTECDNRYQPKGTYLTEQNLQGYATQEWVRGEEYLYRSGGTMDARAEIGITTKLFIGNSTSSDTCYTKFNCILHGGGDESNPNWVIHDNGYAEFKSSVSANAFYASSDIRLKNILDDINIDFDKLKLIPKKYYTWKGSDILQLGTIAQDIQKIYPEVVSKNENGYLSVDYSKLSIIALAAIDKLNERIKELECQIKL